MEDTIIVCNRIGKKMCPLTTEQIKDVQEWAEKQPYKIVMCGMC